MKHFLHKITLLTASAMLALSTFATSIEYKGINYIIDEATSTAKVTYFATSDNTPNETKKYSGEIDIPTKFKYNDVYYRVTSIGEKAFYGCENIAYINISGLITEIGSQAFGNNKMTDLIIPDNVTKIAEDAFKGSNINLFIKGSFEDYSFLKEVSTKASVFAPQATLQNIMTVWTGEPKNIEQHYYLEDASTLTSSGFRLVKTEYYSLPNAEMFEFSSVITHGVEIFADEETGIYSWTGLNPGDVCEFVINYNIDGEDLANIIKHKAKTPEIICENGIATTSSYTATITSQEEGDYIATEKGLIIANTKYKADDNGKVEITGLTENQEYTAKPYAVYKGKTYYGTEFTFTANNSTGIANVAASEAKVVLNNASAQGYIEVTVSCEGDASYSIINITGQKEKEGTLDGDNKTNNIATDELSAGIYLLNISGEKVNKTLKFIIR